MNYWRLFILEKQGEKDPWCTSLCNYHGVADVREIEARFDLFTTGLNILKYVVKTDFENRQAGGQSPESSGALGGSVLPQLTSYCPIILLALCLFDATHTSLQGMLGSGKALLLS